MKNSLKLAVLAFFGVFFSACNTLYSSKTTQLEIFVPAKIFFQEKYDTIAIRYNNINAGYNPNFAGYYQNNELVTDTKNTDSIASEIYYNSFLSSLKNSRFFDSIIEIERGNYSNVLFSDSLLRAETDVPNDSLETSDTHLITAPVANFWSLAGHFQPKKEHADIRTIDPELATYTKDELARMRDSIGAKMLLSLDYFATTENELAISNEEAIGVFDVFVVSYWNFFDLENLQLTYFYDRVDTITWDYVDGVVVHPPREEAIKEAAKIASNNFTNFITPHWVDVQRLYYISGQVELKQTNALVAEGKWLEAAEIWKRHVENPNKKIAAKCMFNMALACEMLNQLDAAVDWAVKSYYVFGQKNAVHEHNCKEYINILNQRKLDIKRIEHQYNPQPLRPDKTAG
ncbi:hypothetical protein SAMN05444274_10288 [Mariniphaga anaerophila]|uniref:Tetratricopeptide repeat-containing protein n=1 Tax=Mariniphaga anaerophila TaxID=1484053 RepID=A0A1M4VFS7_9BACT|nr:DUF6340 family protein [Mariniphaga anaerophila]SHE67866.1 hypothetical protein SAMN05444274_10288 [Mariniphaga anaerophila]